MSPATVPKRVVYEEEALWGYDPTVVYESEAKGAAHSPFSVMGDASLGDAPEPVRGRSAARAAASDKSATAPGEAEPAAAAAEADAPEEPATPATNRGHTRTRSTKGK